MTHWIALGHCFVDRVDARQWATDELARTEPGGAHPVLVDLAVVACPIDWRHKVEPRRHQLVRAS